MSYFGKNTCVTLRHNYGSDVVDVLSARTGNVIAEVDFSTLAPEIGHSIEAIAISIMGMKKFPRNRKMNRSWSPIRLTPKAQADAEITRATIANFAL